MEAGLDCNSSSERKSLLSDRRASIMSRSTILGGESEEAAERKRKEEEEERVEVFHCWVYVHIPEAAFFLEATTGRFYFARSVMVQGEDATVYKSRA